MHDQDLGGLHVVRTGELGERAAARVHEILRLGQQDLARLAACLDIDARDLATRLALPVTDPVVDGQAVDDGEADAVPRELVLLAGVAEAADDADVFRSLCHGYSSVAISASAEAEPRVLVTVRRTLPSPPARTAASARP